MDCVNCSAVRFRFRFPHPSDALTLLHPPLASSLSLSIIHANGPDFILSFLLWIIFSLLFVLCLLNIFIIGVVQRLVYIPGFCVYVMVCMRERERMTENGLWAVWVLFISLGHQVNVEVMLHLVGETYCPDGSNKSTRGNEQKYSLKLAKGKLMMNKIRQFNVHNPRHYRFYFGATGLPET